MENAYLVFWVKIISRNVGIFISERGDLGQKQQPPERKSGGSLPAVSDRYADRSICMTRAIVVRPDHQHRLEGRFDAEA